MQGLNPILLILIIVWTLSWKGVALWKAAQNRHKWWFVALLAINTLAILEIIYIFIFSKRKNSKQKNKELLTNDLKEKNE